MGYGSPANDLSRQATTAACSAPGQHFSAILGGHAGTKSMIALSLENAGLKCPLHGGYLFLRKLVSTSWLPVIDILFVFPEFVEAPPKPGWQT